MIAVFLNNKLITADTILPLMIAVGRIAPSRRILYYCFDRETADHIRRNNVLNDALNETGRLICLGRAVAADGRGAFVHKLRMARHLLGLALWALWPRTRFVHFKALNTGPFRLLARLRPAAPVFVEANCWGYHRLMIERIGNLGRAARKLPAPGRGGVVVGFSPEWPELSRAENAAKTRLIVPPTHLGRDWLDWVRERADSYLADDLSRAGLPADGPVLVYILGYFGRMGFLSQDDSMSCLFEETMDALAEISTRVAVLLKPHAITDVSVVERALALRPHGRFAVTHLHPAVLATRAVAFVANHYSTTFGDASAFGVPTIEYTDYSQEALAVTEGGSMRAEFVSHFLQRTDRGPEGLSRILDSVIANKAEGRFPLPADDGALRPLLHLLAA